MERLLGVETVSKKIGENGITVTTTFINRDTLKAEAGCVMRKPAGFMIILNNTLV